MIKRILIGMSGLALGVALAGCGELSPSAAPRLSPIAEQVLANGTDWLRMETAQFVYYAADEAVLRAVRAETEHAYAVVSERLGLPEAAQQGVVFVIADAAQWDAVLSAGGQRVEGVALHVEREIYVRRQADASPAFGDIPHELVHFRIWQAYGRGTPLWLEEGVASYLGWQVTQAYHQQFNRMPERPERRFAAEQLVDWAAFWTLDRYPADPDRLRAFYWQAETLVAEWAAAVSEAEWQAGVQAGLRQGTAAPLLWQALYGWSAAESVALIERVEAAIVETF
jgi:hypothetical protein